VLKALADIGDGKSEDVADAIASYGIDADALEPRLA
jgi:pyruvate dehydrogenase complex dehydrogenase (E1) component